MKVLQARLAEIHRRKEQAEAKMSEPGREQRAIEWGNQIRVTSSSPYTLVKDHRTNAETGNIIAVGGRRDRPAHPCLPDAVSGA